MEDSRAAKVFLSCCGSRVWADRMAAWRPYASREALHSAADRAFGGLRRPDWLEAFAAHPRIGESTPRDAGSANPEVWSSREQAGMAGADRSVRERLAAANDDYFERFGHVFLIHATGKSAEEMLRALEERLDNDPDEELEIAAEQQRLITHDRLEKLTGT